MSFSSIDEILEDLAAGRMVIIVDDEDRENEGDLLMLAEKVRPEDINFMARYGRGLICLSLTEARCAQLKLPLMVSQNREQFSTAFTVSIEAAQGVTTGISAQDRARTVQAAVAKDAKPTDIVQPGHVFPLMARAGGVLTRAGHTEAGVDLARLAGAQEPAAVIVEILNEDGSMARRPDLEVFAQTHGLKIGSIEDLIRYRMKHERSIERVAESEIETRWGTFRLVSYKDHSTGQTHLALVRGKPSPETPIAVRVHVHQPVCDLLEPLGSDCGWPLSDVMARLGQMDEGVAIILRPMIDEDDVLGQLRHWQTGEMPTTPAKDHVRTYGVGAQILKDLSVQRMRVMSAPKRFHALAGYGLEVVDYIYDEVAQATAEMAK
ncbi:MAG: 3,4-dihydroxy-2-butanone-4-phosphate synthase [Halothiobacillus sp. 14-56-357]|jgi:3,4-dihydroxy 2-butanone 4-phosphate synthase/GTP cyclohydrolase II|uniref:bifunctional 3,4-dihydroxy-2-butanone-4-phosphate synthase/GTP cyclohydrolase II n=1 Tax=Halothiobacillus sp. 15-55-196 TaxID=1970382 RepID=UPI000BDD05F1|nr:bifunctional 3,4-dihydroxy-2-butanone-4-phosphate synthase/GTP cyclohydrolase II [Halothiobacillus sp. 15-55-196]OZB36502.1 MAG: 3,4-dihydroxy-2-butanone-4-phosphate synthase [Halothiobacillus sp. 15-55-196]OZB56897.1 MAG: 3,4-dihydroxy-2-butanone-4-phosphate synthase [Halothiobacillus sp. 14-56-357]OZB78116.1 MAG: 3,4-dihydroxy-2-butanone-4-phosphate synthase [Halothiobacillus sp. 13-55-115]